MSVISKNVLFVSASIGSGHTQAAAAVCAKLTYVSPVTGTVVDFLNQANPIDTMIKKTYLKMLGVLPDAYEFLYHWSQDSDPGLKIKSIIALVMKRKMQKLLSNYQPDMLVFTHPFPCCVAAYLRRTNRLSIPLAAILTDFSYHQMWAYDEIDTYFVANSEIKAALITKGIEGRKIFVTGIPISPKFTPPLTEHPGKVSSSLPQILVMGGGLGLGGVEEAVKSLQTAKSHFELIVVSGSNEQLKEKLLMLKPSFKKSVRILGYTDKINELMALASLLITKPGGLTCSEALAMKLPLLVLDPLPGQEEENAEFLIRRGVALRISSNRHLASLVDELLAAPHKLAAMKANSQALHTPDAAGQIASVLSAGLVKCTTIFPAS